MQPPGPGVPGYVQGPPQQQYYAPPPQQYAPPPRTSGLAIVSLIFAIIWIVGVGSLFAIVLGIAAKSKIRRSGGSLKGSGLSTAGIVIGCFGLFTGVGAVIASVTIYHAATKSTIEPLGQTVPLSAFAQIGGISRITVSGVQPATPSAVAGNLSDKFLAVAMTVCPSITTGPAGSAAGSLSQTELVNRADHYFYLKTPKGTASGALPVGTNLTPNLYAPTLQITNGCASGYLTFEVASSFVASSVEYAPTPVTHYEWQFPPA